MDLSFVPLLMFTALSLHSFVIFPATLLIFRKRPLTLSTASKTRSIALLFCCHNEEKTLPSKIANLKALLAKHPELSVHVYLDACTDRSAELLKGVKGIRVIEGEGRNGKNAGINIAMAGIDSDVVAFNDANVIIDEAAIGNVQHYFNTEDVGCVCAHLRYINDGESSTAKVGGLYWRFEEWLKRAETLRGSTVAVDGSLFFIRRELFTPLPVQVPNDFYTSLDILSRGYRVVSAEDVRCYENSATASSDEFRRKVRITTRAMTTHLMLRRRLRKLPLKLRYIYTSHKMVRWFQAYWLAGSYVSAGVYAAQIGRVAEFAVFSAAVFLLWALALKAKVSIAHQLRSIGEAFVATALSATKALLGARVSVWAVPASSR